MIKNTVQVRPLTIERRLAEKDWRRVQLANESGVAVTTISNACRGKPVSVRTAVLIAKALNVNFDDLLIKQ